MNHASGRSVAAKSMGVFSRDSVRGLFLGAALFLGVICISTTAYRMEGWKLEDAFYMVIITVFSVGYEEVEPVNTHLLHAITILTIVAGDAGKVYFIGSLLRFVTEAEIAKAMEEQRKSKNIDTITEHAIVCGYGRIGQTLARELTAKAFPFLIIDNNAERVALAHAHGHLALMGDAGEEGTLSEAHVERAVVFATVLPSDMVNVFITLTARNMRPDLRIIARAEDPATERKLKQAGANEIILPAFVGGMQIANSITHPSLSNILQDANHYLKNDLKELGIAIVQYTVIPDSADDRKTIQQFVRDSPKQSLVLAVRKADGTLVQHPEGSHRLEARDVIMMLSH